MPERPYPWHSSTCPYQWSWAERVPAVCTCDGPEPPPEPPKCCDRSVFGICPVHVEVR